jgi:hypothetical protein
MIKYFQEVKARPVTRELLFECMRAIAHIYVKNGFADKIDVKLRRNKISIEIEKDKIPSAFAQINGRVMECPMFGISMSQIGDASGIKQTIEKVKHNKRNDVWSMVYATQKS